MLKVIYPVIGNEQNLPFYLTGIGVSDPEYHIERENGLTSHQFLFTMDGKGVLEVEGKRFPQTRGSCFYLSPRVAHKYCPVDGNWTTAWMVFRGNELSEMMQRLGFRSYMVQNPVDDSALNLFDQIYTAAGDRINGSERCSLLVYEMILKMSRCFNGTEPLFSRKPDVLKQAVSYIDAHFTEDITLEALAAYTGVSQQHFCRCFRTGMGMRPMEYIARRRIAQSKALLLGTEMSVSEIAEKTGYSGVTYFGMVFRKYVGVSPSEFRKSNGLSLL